MHAELRFSSWCRLKWLTTFTFLLVGCSGAAPSPVLPAAPDPPTGWTSVGNVGGQSSPGWTLAQFTFSGRPVAVNAVCRGNGTLFVIVSWSGVSLASGPARFETAAFPCSAPAETAGPSRIELTTAPSGTSDVNAFVIEGPGAVASATYAVSVEERDP